MPGERQPQDPARRAAALFAATFGGQPQLLGRGPGRVNLIGEHTDYNEGFALPFAIDRVACAAARLRPDRQIGLVTEFAPGVVHSQLDRLGQATGTGSGWAGYPLGIVWALGEAGADLTALPGFEVAFASDVPVGAGLSSSAAIETAIGVALNELWGLGLDRRSLARVGQRAENVVVGAPTGIMDQTAALSGGPDCAVLLDCRSLAIELVPLGLPAAGLGVVVIDSRVAHAHADGGYRNRRAACEHAAAAIGVRALRDLAVPDLPAAADALDEVAFRRVRHVVTENQRVLATAAMLRAGAPRGIGDLLLASHASMRDDFEISTPELDTAVTAAVRAGALGARMTGGGFGGSVIALTEQEAIAQVGRAVRRAYRGAGFAEPGICTVRAVPGATVLPAPATPVARAAARDGAAAGTPDSRRGGARP